jgi:AcrR family transcriptional regulator
MELYGERGFEQTTVAEIAKRAGLTERTFFRYFTDKREVLFWGADALAKAMVGALESAPESMTPIDAIAVALDAGAKVLPDQPEYPRRRQQIIAANAELGERERIKLASLAAGLAGALRRRGVAEHVAMLAAETGVAVFRVSFERWIDERNTRDFAQLLRDSLEELKAVAAGRQ